MTELDDSLKEFQNLSTLNLCGNHIAEFDPHVLPRGLIILELQNNRISNLDIFVEKLPSNLICLGLARNLLYNGLLLLDASNINLNR